MEKEDRRHDCHRSRLVLAGRSPQVYADDVSGTDSGQQAAMSSEYDTTLDDPTDITKSLTKSDLPQAIIKWI